MRGISTAIAIALMAVCPSIAASEEYPSRIIEMVVPYSAGGATDIIGRVVAQGMSSELGQQVVIKNVPGAAGSIGASQVAVAEPDGYTILMGALTSHSINSNLLPPPGFNLRQDFAPVALVGNVGLAVAAAKKLPVNNFEEFLALARKQPGNLTYASSGTGSPQHLGMEMLKSMAQIDLLHVPYQGSSPALTDVIGGHVDVIMDTVPSLMSAVKGGEVKLLAVSTPEQSPFLNGTPTIADLGIPGFDVRSWFGVLAPAGTPDEVRTKLNTVINKVLAKPETVAAFARQGVTPVSGTPEVEDQRIAAEVDKWRGVIDKLGPINR